MAVDKLVDSSQLDSDLNSVANAILEKSGGTGPIAFPAGFVSAIDAIPTGGGGSAVSFSISVNGDAVIYYVDDSGTPTESQFIISGGTVSGSGLGNSLACVLCTEAPGSLTNLQFYKRISLGSRANYKYAYIYQVSE